MIVLSKNVRYVRIFAGVPREGRQCQTTVMHGLRPSILRCAPGYLRPICVTYSKYCISAYTVFAYSHAYWPLSSIVDSSLFLWWTGRCYVSLSEKIKRVIF